MLRTVGNGCVFEGNGFLAVDIDSWYLVTAKSDQLIAAVKDECIVAELVRITAGEVVHAAAGACARAQVLKRHHDTLLVAGFAPEMDVA